MHILTVLGARPQFIKAAAVSKALQAAGLRETLVHSGQHYDPLMDQVFFDELGIPKPAINFGIGSGQHGYQTAKLMQALEVWLLARPKRPDAVLVYGDTNTTLGGAVVAAKLGLPLAHVEAGLRSFNRAMPEEVNRLVTDRLAKWNFAPSETACHHLAQEGMTESVYLVGDVMLDATLQFSALAFQHTPLSSLVPFDSGQFYVATLHRAENTDDPRRLQSLISLLGALPFPVVLPVHPRTRPRLPHVLPFNLHCIAPLGYLSMLSLMQHAHAVLTDSGGLQKEAYWLQKPCITLRNETEWTETLAGGWNQLAGKTADDVLQQLEKPPQKPQKPFGRIGNISASERIAAVLAQF